MVGMLKAGGFLLVCAVQFVFILSLLFSLFVLFFLFVLFSPIDADESAHSSG